MKKEKVQSGKLYYLDNTKQDVAFYLREDGMFNQFFPIKESGAYIKYNHLVEFLSEQICEPVDTNDTLDKLITEDIHNLWLDAPKVVREILDKYMEEFRNDEYKALEAERVLEEQELHNLEQERQDGEPKI